MIFLLVHLRKMPLEIWAKAYTPDWSGSPARQSSGKY